MMRQYGELKRRFPDYLLLFRLGDFYELFNDDAHVASRLLQLTLTSRQNIPMAGVPHHAADTYIARLIRGARWEVLPRAGHIPAIEDERNFDAALLDFLRATEARAR